MHSPREPESKDARPIADQEREMSVVMDGVELPRELLREVASSLRSLSKVMPYEEYAVIVHRIARVRWQCEHIKNARSADAASAMAVTFEKVYAPVEDETLMRFWDAALEYASVDMPPPNDALLARAREECRAAQETRERVAADRERRTADTEARARLRAASREYVARLKDRGDSLDEVLRSTGTVLSSLRAQGGLSDDQGAFEVDVQRIVAEEYCSAA